MVYSYFRRDKYMEVQVSRREFWMKARIVFAGIQWFGVLLLVHFFGADIYFMAALIQALLLTSVLCSAFVLHPPPSPDPEGPHVFVNRMDSLSGLTLWVGTILCVIFVTFVLLMS